MKIKIKSFNGELPSYLTENKVYVGWYATDMWSSGIYADDGSIVVISNMKYCHHLNGGEWEEVKC